MLVVRPIHLNSSQIPIKQKRMVMFDNLIMGYSSMEYSLLSTERLHLRKDSPREITMHITVNSMQSVLCVFLQQFRQTIALASPYNVHMI